MMMRREAWRNGGGWGKWVKALLFLYGTRSWGTEIGLGERHPSDGVTWEASRSSVPEQTGLRPGAVNGRGRSVAGEKREADGVRDHR
jgi:hypothetical protein